METYGAMNMITMSMIECFFTPESCSGLLSLTFLLYILRLFRVSALKEFQGKKGSIAVELFVNLKHSAENFNLKHFDTSNS